MPSRSGIVHRTGPEELALDRVRQPVDLRSAEERMLMGWIPGSRWIADLGRVRTGQLPHGRVVLYCATGRRSVSVVRQLEEEDWIDLSGGMSAWVGAGLPVATVGSGPMDDLPATVQRLRRDVLACFVGASAESDLELDVVRLVETSLPHEDRWLAWMHGLDRLAAWSWRLGLPLDAIAANSTRYATAVDRLFPRPQCPQRSA